MYLLNTHAILYNILYTHLVYFMEAIWYFLQFLSIFFNALVSVIYFGDTTYHKKHVDGLVQDRSNSIVSALELPQSCTKLSMYVLYP